MLVVVFSQRNSRYLGIDRHHYLRLILLLFDILSLSTSIGSVADGDPTNDPSPELEITLNAAIAAGETVEVLRDGAVIGNATGAVTSFTFTDSGLTVGTYVYSARVVDAAGNEAAEGSDYTIEFVTDPAAVNQNSVAGGGTFQLSTADLLSQTEGADLFASSPDSDRAASTDPLQDLGLFRSDLALGIA